LLKRPDVSKSPFGGAYTECTAIIFASEVFARFIAEDKPLKEFLELSRGTRIFLIDILYMNISKVFKK